MENSGLGYTEFDIRRVIPGEAEAVRVRIAAVLEDFNYRVLNEQPLQARRSQQKNILAANSLDLTTKLTVGLKNLSQHATLATFDYAVQQVWTEGDKQTFEREVDAIVALALAAARPTVCRACGAESAGDSRFCRACGAPASRESLPAELEVMRLTADARAAHQEHVTGVVVMLLDLAVALPLILFGKPKAVNFGIVLLIIGQLLAWGCLFYGMLRQHRMLNPKRAAREEEQPPVPRAVPAAQAQALPPPSAAWASVTEGTTELLGATRREKVEVPLKRADKDTDAI
ncbi:MAG TPA: hypothetical protein VE360_10760 [Pyrinomonadaceae bacterium]|nr:hypothetical protein [Pyrinomonadaceae bacterium]